MDRELADAAVAAARSLPGQLAVVDVVSRARTLVDIDVAEQILPGEHPDGLTVIED
jgi:hypothetical protein